MVFSLWSSIVWSSWSKKKISWGNLQELLLFEIRNDLTKRLIVANFYCMLPYKYLSIWVQVGRDPRPVMREAYNMFKDGGDPEKVLNVVYLLEQRNLIHISS